MARMRLCYASRVRRRSRIAGMVFAIALLGCGVASAEDAFVTTARGLSVRRLESGLPDLSLERWLRKLTARKTEIQWESNDCGEATGSAADTSRDVPVCAQASAVAVNGGVISVSVALGTLNHGISGEPALFDATLTRGNRTTTFRSLEALAKAVRTK
jgi:hypothetical protein